MLPKGFFRSGILLLLPVLALTSGCTVMERLRGGEPAEDPSVFARECFQRRTAELEGIEEEAGIGAGVELERARTLLEEMGYFFEMEDFVQVRRLDGALGESLDSIRALLDAGGSPLSKRVAALEEENGRLRSEASGTESGMRELEEEIRTLKALTDMEIQSLSVRLKAVETERDDAIREVVRTRSRIEGLASPAGASAMFAEARVLVDRMEEEAFSLRAQGLLEQGEGYLTSGKKELDAGNPGGAAYLFDLVSSVYQEFRSSNPDRLTVAVRKAGLYRMANRTSGMVIALSRGELITGLEIEKDWFKVRDKSGRVGWVRKNQVH